LLWVDAGSVQTDPPEGSDVSRTPALLCAVILALCTRPAPVPSRSRTR
jgi:hypothetical protein